MDLTTFSFVSTLHLLGIQHLSCMNHHKTSGQRDGKEVPYIPSDTVVIKVIRNHDISSFKPS
jgi:hypothetical protein